MDWIREHPYLSGGLVLAVVVLFVVLRRGGSSAQQSSAGGPSEALQAAGLQAGVQNSAISAQVAQTQLQANSADAATSAAQTVALAKIGADLQGSEYNAAAALQAQQAGYAAAVASTSLTTAAGVQVAGIQANRDITLGGYGVDIAQIQASRDVTINQQNTGAAVDIAGIQGDVTKAQTAAALAATENTNATALGISTVNAGVATHAIDVAGAVEQNRINQQGQQVADAFSLAQQHESDVYGPGGIFVGVNRYGGNLQSNQATVETAILGQPEVGVAIQQSSAEQAQSSASMWSGIVNSLVGGGTKVATAAIGA